MNKGVKKTLVLTPTVKKEIVKIIDQRIKDVHVTKEDFSELKGLVRDIAVAQKEITETQKRTDIHVEELAEAQKRTEVHVENLAEAQKRTEVHVENLAEAQKRTESRVEELTEAQKRTESCVEELTEAQKRTESRVEELTEAQKRTEVRVEKLAETVDGLAGTVDGLAEAQKRTEVRVEELVGTVDGLAEAQKRTETRLEETIQVMRDGFRTLDNRITALGGRWGIMAESTFRNAVEGILEKAGYTVSKGHYGNREVDVVVRNGEHMLVEITSSMRKSDIEKYMASADDYRDRTGIDPHLMVAAIYIPPTVMREIADAPRKIEIFSIED